jgi:hypothetical protein
MATPEEEIRELIHAVAPPQLQSRWVGDWMTQHGFQPAEVKAAVSALVSGVNPQQLSDAVWNGYKKMHGGQDV